MIAVATAAADEIVIWRAETGERLTSLVLPPDQPDLRPWLRLTPDNQTLLMRAGGAQSYSWKLPYCDQDRDDLLLEAHLRSAHETDDVGSLMPVSKDALQRLWDSRPRPAAGVAGRKTPLAPSPARP
jgi:hypothetical protein